MTGSRRLTLSGDLGGCNLRMPYLSSLEFGSFTITDMAPSVTPQLVGNAGRYALRRAIAEPDRYAFEVGQHGDRLEAIERRGQAAYFDGAEERSQLAEGRPLPTDQLERVTKRYPKRDAS